MTIFNLPLNNWYEQRSNQFKTTYRNHHPTIYTQLEKCERT